MIRFKVRSNKEWSSLSPEIYSGDYTKEIYFLGIKIYSYNSKYINDITTINNGKAGFKK